MRTCYEALKPRSCSLLCARDYKRAVQSVVAGYWEQERLQLHLFKYDWPPGAPGGRFRRNLVPLKRLSD